MLILLFIVFVPLLITIILECIVAYFLDLRGKENFLHLIAINCITNPILNFTMNFFDNFLFIEDSLFFFILILFELFVIIIESSYFKNNLKYDKFSFYTFSILLNAISGIVGTLLMIYIL